MWMKAKSLPRYPVASFFGYYTHAYRHTLEPFPTPRNMYIYIYTHNIEHTRTLNIAPQEKLALRAVNHTYIEPWGTPPIRLYSGHQLVLRTGSAQFM